MPSTNPITLFANFPKNLFLMNTGVRVKLRALTDEKPDRTAYDIVARNNLVEPKALNPSTYQAPNGAPMRPNSPSMQSQVRSLAEISHLSTIIYEIPQGTRVPRNLLLVHEQLDHYSLQPGTSMKLEELNGTITHFMKQRARIYKPDRWMKKHPLATETTADPGYQSMSKAAKKIIGVQGFTQLSPAELKVE